MRTLVKWWRTGKKTLASYPGVPGTPKDPTHLYANLTTSKHQVDRQKDGWGRLSLKFWQFVGPRVGNSTRYLSFCSHSTRHKFNSPTPFLPSVCIGAPLAGKPYANLSIRIASVFAQRPPLILRTDQPPLSSLERPNGASSESGASVGLRSASASQTRFDKRPVERALCCSCRRPCPLHIDATLSFNQLLSGTKRELQGGHPQVSSSPNPYPRRKGLRFQCGVPCRPGRKSSNQKQKPFRGLLRLQSLLYG